jgi:hypothetical protein
LTFETKYSPTPEKIAAAFLAPVEGIEIELEVKRETTGSNHQALRNEGDEHIKKAKHIVIILRIYYL